VGSLFRWGENEPLSRSAVESTAKTATQENGAATKAACHREEKEESAKEGVEVKIGAGFDGCIGG